MTRRFRRFATWLFALTMRFYPAGFRRQFGEDAMSTFAGRLRQAAQLGGTWRMVRRAALDLLAAATGLVAERLARGTGQRRELAVRTAMGATRARLIRQLLTETTVLALIGGSVGLLLAWWGTQALLSYAPRIPRIDQAGVDPMVLGFTLVVSLCAGVLFGLIPAFKGTRACAQNALRQDDVRTGSSIGALSSRNLLVAAELALVVALLVAAGLTLRSFAALQRVDLGFDPDNKLLVPITLPTSFQYDDRRHRAILRPGATPTGHRPGR